MRTYLSNLLATLILICGCSVSISAQNKTELDYASAGNKQITDTFNPANGILLIEGTIDQDSSTVSNSVDVTYQTGNY